MGGFRKFFKIGVVTFIFYGNRRLILEATLRLPDALGGPQKHEPEYYQDEEAAHPEVDEVSADEEEIGTEGAKESSELDDVDSIEWVLREHSSPRVTSSRSLTWLYFHCPGGRGAAQPSSAGNVVKQYHPFPEWKRISAPKTIWRPPIRFHFRSGN